MASQPCKFFAQGSCRFGNKCKFQHGQSSGTPGASSSVARGGQSRPPATRASSSGPVQPPTGPESTMTNVPVGPVPRGACNTFWATNKCKFGNTCKYRHVFHGAPNVVVSAPTNAALKPLFEESVAVGDTGTQNGDAGSGADAYIVSNVGDVLGATDALSSLRRYMRDDYRFDKPLFIYSMMKVLTSATSGNKAWNDEDGQLLLAEMSSNNGQRRLSEVITWPEVALVARPNSLVLGFQRGYVPLIGYLASDFVVKSSIGHRVNAVYNVLIQNIDAFIEKMTACMQQGLQNRSFKDSGFRGTTLPDSYMFASLAIVLFECLNRFKNVIVGYPSLHPFVLRAHEWFSTWSDGISSSPPRFSDPFAQSDAGSREVLLSSMQNKYDRIVSIVNREQAKLVREPRSSEILKNRRPHLTHEGHVAALFNSYEGPGAERQEGPRHDNDFTDHEQIRIVPTSDELKCRLDPFLPGNFYEAPHPLPAGSMERLLDVQFRLLREELNAPLRTSVHLVLDDISLLESKNKKEHKNVKLSKILTSCGGRYRGEGQDSVMFGIYTNIVFSSMSADRRGMSAEMFVAAPPAARQKDTKSRVAFWERSSGKRLMQGGLVALLWKVQDETLIYLATISSSTQDIAASAKHDKDNVKIRLAFFDPEAELRILQVLKQPDLDTGSFRLLIEAPVMFEAIRPFLSALCVEPENIPFQQYLVHHPLGKLKDVVVQPPAYARRPGFRYQLASLFDSHADITNLQLQATDRLSVDNARKVLKEKSRLDPSQADAVVDVLVREVSLVQGPPGTGKSYTGIELLRVLIANKIGPVLLIALTNHALDHLLSAVVDKGITSKIVRLGSRSADEKIAKFSLDQQEMVASKTRLDRTFARDYRKMKTLEEDLKNLMKDFLKRDVHSSQIISYLELQYPEEHELLMHDAPAWVTAMHTVVVREEEGWEVAGRKARDDTDNSLYTFWRKGQDLSYLASAARGALRAADIKGKGKAPANRFELLSASNEELPEEGGPDDTAPVEPTPNGTLDQDVAEQPAEEDEDEDEDSPAELRLADLADSESFLRRFDVFEMPPVPISDRPLDVLLADPSPWACSEIERKRLHEYWLGQVRAKLERQEVDQFKKLREDHAQALADYNEGKVEVRRQLLKNVDIIGATTTGASKLITLLKGVAPRVLLVEEAGQVLEAHILASLVPSVEHLICIGDPLQLRPTLNNYGLSMDNKRGAALFRFDMSLMERLSAELQMSQIDVQRRMRPEVSSLIRNTLYPRLQDHEIVKKYPSVHGFTKDVFFLHHNHRENGDGDESSSKYNTYEVDMIKDLVLYLLRQGCYSKEGDIVVLCAYLGQLARLREALAKEVAVVIDERDEEKLAAQEDDTEAKIDANVTQLVERVQVSKRVRLRTIDNYQGEEGEVVILSLVRNSGQPRGGDVIQERVTIGFLQSENRSNVALSRAKQGLFILGNAHNLSSRSPMWKSVIEQLEAVDAVGDGFPVACHQHPDDVRYIKEPGELPRFAPDGGCLRTCETRLTCGHQCPFKCHSDDPHHASVLCSQPCTRHCPKGHPCPKECSENCGLCMFPILNVQLPCGHVKSTVPCYLMEQLEEVRCTITVMKKLPTCEHSAQMMCSASPTAYACKSRCESLRPCCGKACTAACYECQSLSRQGEIAATMDVRAIPRIRHAAHPCEKTLFCGHRCSNDCAVDHKCTELCTKSCRQSCAHTTCREPCSTPCAPCLQPCVWNCKHYTCPVPCGSVCARLPCDARCDKILDCGHQCPSVCGEDCTIQQCNECATPDQLTEVVDLTMFRSLRDIDPTLGTIDELTITIACGHTFTVETLDGVCHMTDYYTRDEASQQWITPIAPSSDFMTPPACPTCRASITALRYGRVVKRANLDILETNVGSRMVRSLDRVHHALDRLERPALQERLKTYGAGAIDEPATPTPEVLAKRQRERDAVLSQNRPGPVPESVLDPANPRFHGAPKSDVREWRQATSALSRAYKQAMAISDTRSSHIHAWEAGFTALFNAALDAIVKDPSLAQADPAAQALLAAHQMVGQPKPIADQKYRVKAVCASVIIRFALVDLAEVLLEALAARPARPAEQCRIWADYMELVLRTCIQDAERAAEASRQSESHRQASEIVPMIMQAHLKLFHVSIVRVRSQGELSQRRQELVDAIAMRQAHARKYLVDAVMNHRAARRMAGENEWIQEKLLGPCKEILEEWEKVAESIKRDTFYSPVTKDDMASILQGLHIGTVGHFYRCSNGHPYVITECGGAMERSQCPTCGVVIGGSGHYLDSSNSRDTDLQALAHQAGAANIDHWAPR